MSLRGAPRQRTQVRLAADKRVCTVEAQVVEHPRALGVAKGARLAEALGEGEEVVSHLARIERVRRLNQRAGAKQRVVEADALVRGSRRHRDVGLFVHERLVELGLGGEDQPHRERRLPRLRSGGRARQIAHDQHEERRGPRRREDLKREVPRGLEVDLPARGALKRHDEVVWPRLCQLLHHGARAQ